MSRGVPRAAPGTRAVFAPGKLVLAGEYAVIDGAPALVMAIDRGVRCEVAPAAERVRIETPDGDDRFVRPALEGAPPGRYRFVDHRPVDLPGKPGFGGSAAACVAACVAAGRPASDALDIHRRVQGGGSGVDVLASVHGGVHRFYGRRARAVTVPVPVVVYSGRSARTGPRVRAFLAWSDRAARRAFVAASTHLVEHFEDDPIASARESWALLTAMAAAAGIDYRTPALDRIVALAVDRGGAARPSGAGGGDVAVAWLPDEESRQDFRRACLQAGLPVIDAAVAGPAGWLAG
ncbi:MAG: hypothetical protein D6798_01210 [Deltaproteobacteria bacterium]|nr:MAG: hypothetical protein D6798_01210 [Deltaproteobacteria bacterium]